MKSHLTIRYLQQNLSVLCPSLEVRELGVAGGGKRPAESGTARPSQPVCAQASAAQRSLCKGRHSHSSSSSWLSKFDCVYSSLVSPLLLSCTILPFCFYLSCIFLFFSLSAFSFLCWLNYSLRFIVPNGQSTAETEGFISPGPGVQQCMCMGCLFVSGFGGWRGGSRAGVETTLNTFQTF